MTSFKYNLGKIIMYDPRRVECEILDRKHTANGNLYQIRGLYFDTLFWIDEKQINKAQEKRTGQ